MPGTPQKYTTTMSWQQLIAAVTADTTALYAGLSVGANPSAKVGATAVNGVATSFMRSDGAPANLTQATGFGTPTGATVVANFSGTAATNSQMQATIAEILTVLKAAGIIGA